MSVAMLAALPAAQAQVPSWRAVIGKPCARLDDRSSSHPGLSC